jgi:hypothetical protein
MSLSPLMTKAHQRTRHVHQRLFAPAWCLGRILRSGAG